MSSARPQILRVLRHAATGGWATLIDHFKAQIEALATRHTDIHATG